MRQLENVLLLHDRKVYIEALNPVLYITEFADGAEHKLGLNISPASLTDCFLSPLKIDMNHKCV